MARERFETPSENDLKKFRAECGVEVKNSMDVFNIASS